MTSMLYISAPFYAVYCAGCRSHCSACVPDACRRRGGGCAKRPAVDRGAYAGGLAAVARSQPGFHLAGDRSGARLAYHPPKPLWQVNVGIGYSSMAVADGKLYTQGWNWRTGADSVVCLNAVTGKLIWKYTYPAGSGVWLDVGVVTCRNSWGRALPPRSRASGSIRWAPMGSVLFQREKWKNHLATPVGERQ